MDRAKCIGKNTQAVSQNTIKGIIVLNTQIPQLPPKNMRNFTKPSIAQIRQMKQFQDNRPTCQLSENIELTQAHMEDKFPIACFHIGCKTDR